MEIAEQIANLILDKTVLGKEWFLFSTILLTGVIAAISAWAGTYLSVRATNRATRTDFKKALKNLEEQTEAVSKIKEDISYEYFEKREIKSTKRAKLEELFTLLAADLEALSTNHSTAVADKPQEFIKITNRVEMLVKLYFKKELIEEFKIYSDCRIEIIKNITKLAKENIGKEGSRGIQRVDENQIYFTKLCGAKLELEDKIEDIANNLTSLSS